MSWTLKVVVTDPSKLQAIRDREEDIMKERIDLLIKAVSPKGAEDQKLTRRAGCQRHPYFQGH